MSALTERRKAEALLEITRNFHLTWMDRMETIDADPVKSLGTMLGILLVTINKLNEISPGSFDKAADVAQGVVSILQSKTD